MSTSLLRHQLSTADRELFDLRYLDPTADDFARNPITKLFPTEGDAQKRALVTIYAAPREQVEVEQQRLVRRLEDPGLRSYEPAAAQTGPLVPGIVRPIATGVMAHDGNGDFTHISSAFVLRTTGSVELIDGDATAAGREGQSGLFLLSSLVHAAQLLKYLVPFGESIERTDWSLLVNVRDADRAMLTGFNQRFERVFPLREPQPVLDRHLQFRVTLQPADGEQARAVIQRLDEYLSYAYGYREPHGHGANGRLVER